MTSARAARWRLRSLLSPASPRSDVSSLGRWRGSDAQCAQCCRRLSEDAFGDTAHERFYVGGIAHIDGQALDGGGAPGLPGGKVAGGRKPPPPALGRERRVLLLP